MVLPRAEPSWTADSPANRSNSASFYKQRGNKKAAVPQKRRIARKWHTNSKQKKGLSRKHESGSKPWAPLLCSAVSKINKKKKQAGYRHLPTMLCTEDVCLCLLLILCHKELKRVAIYDEQSLLFAAGPRPRHPPPDPECRSTRPWLGPWPRAK